MNDVHHLYTHFCHSVKDSILLFNLLGATYRLHPYGGLKTRLIST